MDPPASHADRSDDLAQSIQLIRLAQSGDREAMNQICARYYERVRAIVRRRLGPRLRLAVESVEIVQETFLAAVHDFDRFEVRDNARLINWLARIAENRIHEARRGLDRKREVQLLHLRSSLSSGDLVLDPAASITLPVDHAIREEEGSIIERCLDELRPEYREVISLRMQTGGSWEAIAEMIESNSADAARMLYARAIQALTLLVGKRQRPQD